MNQQDRNTIANFTSATTGIADMLKKTLSEIAGRLPEKEAKEFAQKMKEADIQGKTDALRSGVSGLSDMLKKL